MAEQVEQQEALHLEADVRVDDDTQAIEDARSWWLQIAVLDDKSLLDNAGARLPPQADELVAGPLADQTCAVELVTRKTVHVKRRSFLQNAGFGTIVAAFGLSTPPAGRGPELPGCLSSQGLGPRFRA